jgi:hypothetical protein
LSLFKYAILRYSINQMDEICEFIIANENATEYNGLSVPQLLTEDYTNDIIDGIYTDLYQYLEKSKIKDIERIDNNIGIQRAIIVSFKYENIQCYIREHFDSQRNYWQVSIFPI